MQFWISIAAIGALAWLALGLLIARTIGLVAAEPPLHERELQPRENVQPESKPAFGVLPAVASDTPIHVLVVDDDADLRALVRTTFELAHIVVEEAESAGAAAQRIAERHPDVVVLDVGMPGVDGLEFCRALKSNASTCGIPVVLLTGAGDSEFAGWQAGANAFLTKPFRPLELLKVVERFGEATEAEPLVASRENGSKQLLLYAQDFRHLLEVERGQRRLLQGAYHETVVALAGALEAKDGGTGAHSERVRRYATELASVVQPDLLSETGAEYGFILHDIGKIAIPDAVLRKNGGLTEAERRMIETHPILGEQMVGNAALLRGAGAQVVRSHHERWDGRGYPDRLVADEIPVAARIFSLADALDAMTSDRPYRSARPWAEAVAEIVDKAGSQFDPAVVDAFREHEEPLRRVYYELSTN